MNSLKDVFNIIIELDTRFGHSVAMFLDAQDIEVSDSVTNTLACCFSDSLAIDEIEDRLDEVGVYVELDDDIHIDEDATFYLPTLLMISKQAMYLPYEYFREIVIHEYAHALLDIEHTLALNPMVEDEHGKEFQETVKKLGGRFFTSHFCDCDFYNKEVVDKAIDKALRTH